jgi:CHAT domain-containing protein
VTGETVRTATDRRTVAYVAASFFGGFAIVIDAAGDAAVVMLPKLSVEGLEGEAARFAQRTVALASTPQVRASGIRGTCRWIGQAVMAPLADALGDTPAVVLVPVGALASLPLHAAPTRHGSPALADRLYTYAPRATMLRRPSATAGPDRSVLAVADPARATGDRLHGTRAEAAVLARCFTAVRCLAGTDATTQAVLSALPAASLLHLGCHGVSDPLEPMRSALLLAGTDRLRLSDLLVTDVAHLDLAFLSACQSAVSDTDLPGESMNLAAGLAAAGARAVIGSLWPVDDAATAELTETFYEAVADGIPPAWALRTAQLRMATGPPPWSAPYFWAGLVYLGG